MIRSLRKSLLPLLLGATPAAAAPDPIDGIRADYLAAVTDERAVASGLSRVESLRASPDWTRDRLRTTIEAYEGALITLRAKHATWPPTKLHHLRHGLAILDGVVTRDPEHLETRYLRLMSCYSLPRALGRRASVAEDFAALARLLPSARGEYPPDHYRAIVTFVLQKGSLSAPEQARLQASLNRGAG